MSEIIYINNAQEVESSNQIVIYPLPIDENSYVLRSEWTGEFRRDVGSATEGRNLVRPSVVLRNVVESSILYDYI